MPEILTVLSMQCSLCQPVPLELESETVRTRACVRRPYGTNRGERGQGRGARGGRAVIVPRARGAPLSVLGVSRDNLARFTLREQGRLIGMGTKGGHGSPPQGPIEGLESPICK